jgi:hypothetical protein
MEVQVIRDRVQADRLAGAAARPGMPAPAIPMASPYVL